MEQFLNELYNQEIESWRRIHQGVFWRHILNHGIDKSLYCRLMTEIYHYTYHNAQNQALAAVGVGSERLPLLNFCLHHAYEEAGHDLMVLHDLELIGVDRKSIKKTSPLPETKAFVSYLYSIASKKDATARLGYSYWAEGCYTHIADLLTAIRRDLKLGEKEMTFFVEHSVIDTSHIEKVKKMIKTFCTDRKLQEDVLDVLRTSLYLQGQMLDGIYHASFTEMTDSVA
jgi:pyrroloquinoline quinone (PQQ) biosynthesis protein C